MIFFAASAYAADPERGEAGVIRKGVVSYGDCCANPYGICKRQLDKREAINTLRSYFRQRGFTIEVVEHRGRFIKADIYKGAKPVDCIILDRKTGRIRSTY